MRDDFRLAEDKMQPMIDKYNADIQETRLMNEKTLNNIDSIQRTLEENMQRINQLKGKTKELLEDEEKKKET